MWSLINIQLGKTLLEPFALSCLITTVLSLLLGAFVYFANRKTFLNRLWAAVSFAVAAWSLGFLGVVVATNANAAFRAQILLDISAIFIPIFLLHFTFVFLKPNRQKRIQSFVTQIRTVYALGLGFVLFSLSPLFKKGMTSICGFRFWVEPGKLYFLFPLFFLSVALYSCYLLMQRYFKETGVKKTQIKYILIAIIFGLGGGATNFFPQLIKIYPVGNYFVSLYVLFVGYTITRHHFLNLRVVMTEMLTAMISVALFIDIFLATSLPIILFKVVIFLIFVYFGILLIKSVHKEIKRRKQLESITTQLKLANTALKKLDQAKTEFLAIASHQLRTPLTAARGYLSLMRHGDVYGQPPAKFREPLREVYQSIIRLVKLTNRLLNVSRIDTGRLRMNLQDASLEKLISSILEEFKPQAEEKHLYLKLKKPKGKIPLLQFDPEKIRQVLINLIDNSLKYTQKGGVEISLRLIDERAVEIQVKDTGAGMSKQELSKIFKSFSRGLAGQQFHSAGAGLGLYIAKRFVQLHQGRIWATSPGKDKGSTMWVELLLKLDQAKLKKDLKSFSTGGGEKIPW